MVKEREQLAEAILNHALEIICLLTVEDYIIVKRPDGTRCAFSIRATEVKSNTCDSTSGCPELSFTLLGMEDKTQRMIAELANKIIQLLTRKVTCGAVAVHLSKDEHEYLEGHGAQSKNSQNTFTVGEKTDKSECQKSQGKTYNILCSLLSSKLPASRNEQPTAPVQRSTEQSYPIRFCIKEEPKEEPHSSTGFSEAFEKYALPVKRENLSNMVKEREQLAETIINHALEIICLLTVEDFIVVKRPAGTRCTFNIHATEVKSDMCGSTSGCPELSFTLLGMEDKTRKKITELASKIVHLLTSKMTCENVAVYFSKDKCEYLGKQSKDSQDTCTIEQPTSPVQQSTEQSCPIRCCIKEEPQDRPHYSTEQPTSPVQQSTETIHHIKYCKVEPGEEPHHSAGGTSALPSSEFIPGSPERKPLSTVNVHLPFVEAQTTSGFNFISAYNIKLEPGGDSSGDTEDSADEDGTSALPPSEFISERKPLSTVNVHLPFMEAQTTSGFNFPSSGDNKPEPGGESSDDTEDSADEESSQVSHSSGRKRVHSIYHLIEEEPKESQDSDISVSEDPFGLDCTDKDEDYIPLRTTNKRARTHKSTSEKLSLSCEVCGKILGSKRTLDKHLQIHTGERPHACDECDKRFSCQSHLDAHMRTHIGERPYKCNQCSRRFFNHQHLVLHQVVHTGEKPYSCPVCGKGFTRQSSVVKHSSIHAEQKPFVCSECGKSYCQYASLVVHQRQHSGEKPFVCKYCDQAFPCKDTMLNHQGTHTRTFPCAKCDKCFISRSSLLKHKQKVHTKEPKPA